MCSCQTLHSMGMVTRRSNNLNQDRYGGPLKKAWQSHVCYVFFYKLTPSGWFYIRSMLKFVFIPSLLSQNGGFNGQSDGRNGLLQPPDA